MHLRTRQGPGAAFRARTSAVLWFPASLVALALLARVGPDRPPSEAGGPPGTPLAAGTLLLDAARTTASAGGGAAVWVLVVAATLWLCLRGLVTPALFLVLTALGAELIAPPAPGAASPPAVRTAATVGALLAIAHPAVPRRARLALGSAAAALVVAVGAASIALGAVPARVVTGWLLGLLWLGASATAFRLGGARVGVPGDTSLAAGEAPAPLRPVVPRLLAVWILLLAVLTAAGLLVTDVLDSTAVVQADRAAVRRLVDWRAPTATALLSLVSRLSGTPVIVGSALLVGAVALARGDRRALRFLAVTMVGEVTLAVGCSILVDRPRPAVPHLEPLPLTASFPSGHVAAAVCWYGALALLARSRIARGRGAVAALALLVVAGSAVSRVYLGVHYPSDILGGLLLGTTWLAAAHRALLAVEPRAPDTG